MVTYTATNEHLSLGGVSQVTDETGTYQVFTSASEVSLDADVVDVNDDGNIDIGEDYFYNTSYHYQGYTVTVDGNEYAVFQNGGNLVIPYDPATVPEDFQAKVLAVGQTNYTQDNAVVANCFVTGTLIATPDGERPVESLQAGDMVLSASGAPVAVKWVHRQKVGMANFVPEAMRPVVITAGALGAGLPERDLCLSGDHALVIDDLLVNAAALVNGRSIRWTSQAEMSAGFTYWHVETELHDEILANGVPVETFIDYVGRSAFDNYRDYLDRHGCERIIPEMPRLRISAGRQVPASIRARIAEAASGGGQAPSMAASA
ncbi:Hint domain-containing protein [Paroceanicella profunda]|uniref:Hint domain-containing protein n=1 Tax=Paroceanicella profunda TaxID=2579971 RepID=A0A5B8G031_9RHOB|nr:Hint domain-containing protein [Paroceanicella profunda]QDL93060.1 Hint domain-containing protein [Paroceanicella profunda]